MTPRQNQARPYGAKLLFVQRHGREARGVGAFAHVRHRVAIHGEELPPMLVQRSTIPCHETTSERKLSLA
jgi:hypothetical protein